MGHPIAVTDDTFEAQVLQADVPVVVDFWAPWCGPCRAIAPILEKLSGEYDGKLVIAKINTDEQQRWASAFGIQGIPTLIVFKNGKEIDRLIGARPEASYRDTFNRVLTTV